KCLKVWRPVLLPRGVMAATAGTGVDASKLGTVATANGALQITYSGQPLYWFAKDKTPGQVKGNMKNKWGRGKTVVRPRRMPPAPPRRPPGNAPPGTRATGNLATGNLATGTLATGTLATCAQANIPSGTQTTPGHVPQYRRDCVLVPNSAMETPSCRLS